MAETVSVCVCLKPASNRCAACKKVAYCSVECQRRDWKSHKPQCKAASADNPPQPSAPTPPQIGTPGQIAELLRVGAKYTIYDESMALGLDPDLISGVNGADMYAEKDGSANFWRLDGQVREQWEAKAQVHNKKSQRFWIGYLSPIPTDKEWVDVVLDAVLHVRLPGHGQIMWQNQVNANILAGLFPHLAKFTPAQNTALLDIFTSRVWCGNAFRLKTGTNILFALGKPTSDLIDQLIRRCLSWTRRYNELDKLLVCVALPIQKHWPEIAGTRILDLCLSMLSPGRPGPPGGRTVPGDKILEIAETSPAACKHLLPVIMSMCRGRMIGNPASKLLALCDSFGVSIRSQNSGVLSWFMVEFMGDNRSTSVLQRLLADEASGKLATFDIEAKDFSLAELRELNRIAMARLGNPEIA